MEKTGKVEIQEGKTRAKVVIDEVMDAYELQTLISRLAVARSQMSPAVGDTFPTLGSTASDAEILIEDGAPMMLYAAPGDSKLRLRIRNRGLGWLIFDLHYDKAIEMRDFLNALTSDEPSTFLKQEIPDGGTSH